MTQSQLTAKETEERSLWLGTICDSQGTVIVEEGKNGCWINNWKPPPHLGICFHVFTSAFLSLHFRCVSYKRSVARLGFNLSGQYNLFTFVAIATILGFICNMFFVPLLSLLYFFLLFLFFIRLIKISFPLFHWFGSCRISF